MGPTPGGWTNTRADRSKRGRARGAMLECEAVSTSPAAASSDPVRMRGWALILGASSGFGEAVSLALAQSGLDIFGVHLDRKATLPNAERIAEAIRAFEIGRASCRDTEWM